MELHDRRLFLSSAIYFVSLCILVCILGKPLADELPEEQGDDPRLLDIQMGFEEDNTGSEVPNELSYNPEDTSIPILPLAPPESSNTTDVGPGGHGRGYFPLPSTSRLWEKGKVYYRFEEKDRRQVLEVDDRQFFYNAMSSIYMATEGCIQFVEDTAAVRKTGVIIYRSSMRTDEDTYESVCYSECLGQCYLKAQEVVVSPMHCEYVKGNYAGSIVHEIVHALGFDHEFQRNDRDEYITVDERIYPDFYSTFEALDDDTKGIPFNYKSIMQYDLAAATKANPNPPATPIGAPRNMGQECKISAGDRNLIERTYAPLCRADKKPIREYTLDYMIPGTDCSVKIDAAGEDGS